MTDYEENINLIPEHMRESVLAWIETGRMPGDFLRNLLSNNLSLTFHHADPTNRAAVYDYIFYLHNYAPAPCWGSPKNVEEWNKQGGIKGKEPS